MVYILLGAGFEEMEALTPCDLLRRAGIEVSFVGLSGRAVTGGHGITIEADCTPDEVDFDAMQMLVLPGGLGGVNSIRDSEAAMALIRRTAEAGKFLTAICAAPTILAELGITDGRRATCHPTMRENMAGAILLQDAEAVRDGSIITGTSAGTAIPFALRLIEALKGIEAAEKVAEEIVYRD